MTDMAESSIEPRSLMGDLLAEPTLDARRLELSDGTLVYEAGAPAEHLYYVHSGQIRNYLPGPEDSARLMEILGPGDWFGIDALADSRITTTRAITVSATVVSMMPVARLSEILAAQPGIALELIRQLASKLQSAREDAGRLVFEDCNARLVKTLLHFSQSAAATPQEGGAVMLHITHRQLAQAVGAARETISLALTQLRQQNLLRTGRNRLLFNPDTLRDFATRPGKKTETVG